MQTNYKNNTRKNDNPISNRLRFRRLTSRNQQEVSEVMEGSIQIPADYTVHINSLVADRLKFRRLDKKRNQI